MAFLVSYVINFVFYILCWHYSRVEDSIYGKRDGAITGVAVVYKEKNNIFLGTKGYKVGVVRDVIMCPRNAMYKPTALQLYQRGFLNLFVCVFFHCLIYYIICIH